MRANSRRHESKGQIAAVRRFNRFYTHQIGLLDDGFLHSPFSLTEVRVLYEIANRPRVTAGEIAHDLSLDVGYLSRILRRFEERAYVTRERSGTDRRSYLLHLTSQGRKAFATLDRRSTDQVKRLLRKLSDNGRQRLTNAMAVIHELLAAPANAAETSVSLREHRPGDIGWAIERHGTIYAGEFGWNTEFEALVARILAQFVERFQPERERCWIAEIDGRRAGCVFLVQNANDPMAAQLRCLLVEPAARGKGLGSTLVNACIEFARQVGYERVVLWTNDVLVSARKIYERAGFQLVQEERHHSFGRDLVGQTWQLNLSSAPRRKR